MPDKRPTEGRNPATINIDLASTDEMVALILNEDVLAAEVARRAAPDIARAVDRATARMSAGGRLHYFGAGASGRLAVLDATELGPTFGLPKDRAISHFPGGAQALIDSTIDLEDGADVGARDAQVVEAQDVVVGVTASGTTPYVRGALEAARERGSYTVLITCDRASALIALADDYIALDTGPEAIAGSTRLKAGTATKVTLNALSTAIMVKLGLTWSNLMIGMSVTNQKLEERAVALLTEATGCSPSDCVAALENSGHSIPEALLSLLAQVDSAAARRLMDSHGTVRAALAAIERSAP